MGKNMGTDYPFTYFSHDENMGTDYPFTYFSQVDLPVLSVSIDMGFLDPLGVTW